MLMKCVLHLSDAETLRLCRDKNGMSKKDNRIRMLNNWLLGIIEFVWELPGT